MTLWLKVTNDELELPLIVADSPQELAERCGVGVNAIYSGVSRHKTGLCKRGQYRKVDYPLTAREKKAIERHRRTKW